jgi:hypothetical protein
MFLLRGAGGRCDGGGVGIAASESPAYIRDFCVYNFELLLIAQQSCLENPRIFVFSHDRAFMAAP